MAEKAKKKQNVVQRTLSGIGRYFRDTKGEMKKVVWPNRKQVWNNFLIVMVFVIAAALIIGGLDLLFNWLFELGIGAISAV